MLSRTKASKVFANGNKSEIDLCDSPLHVPDVNVNDLTVIHRRELFSSNVQNSTLATKFHKLIVFYLSLPSQPTYSVIKFAMIAIPSCLHSRFVSMFLVFSPAKEFGFIIPSSRFKGRALK